MPEPRQARYRPGPVTHTTQSPSRLARFDTLFTEHQRAVLAYAMRRTSTLADAEDAAAETFTIAWRRLDDIPEDAALPWLYGVARRVLANQRRSTSRRDRLAAALGRGEDDVRTPLRLGDDVDAPAFRALATLSAADQEVLRLVAWEELGNQAIAEVLGITPNAVAIRLHRARQRFAAALGRDHGSTAATIPADDLKYPAPSRTSTDVKGNTA